MKLRWPPLRVEARIALGLVAIFLSLLILLDVVFGLVPDRASIERQSRQRAAYSLAVLLVHARENNPPATASRLVSEVARLDPQIVSVAVRDVDGTLEPILGEHAAHWSLPEGARSTLTNVRVPILEGSRVWGHMEISFRPVYGQLPLGWLSEPSIRALLVLAIAATTIVYLYLRRVLQHLDPGQVIPQRVREAFDVLDEGVLILDAHARVMMVNEAFRRLDPHAAPVKVGRPVTQFEWLVGAIGIEADQHPWTEALRLGTPTGERELLIADASGRQPRETVIKATPIVDAVGRARGSMVTLTDVSALHRLNRELKLSMQSLATSREQLKEQNEELHRLATRDPLTGCLNRRAFFDLATRALTQSRNRELVVTCVMADIDHFKQFNDRYGHALGDEVIKAVAEVLTQGVRGTDFVCRYGGEEFCIVLTQLDLQAAMSLAQRLCAAVQARAAAHITTVPDLRVTASFGVAAFTPDVDGLETLIDRADQALYWSKRAGRNRVTRWTATPVNSATGTDA